MRGTEAILATAGVDTAWVRQLIASREGPQAISNPDRLMRSAAVAQAYWQLYLQPRDASTFEHEIRPFGESDEAIDFARSLKFNLDLLRSGNSKTGKVT